jgi:hypothetical protein
MVKTPVIPIVLLMVLLLIMLKVVSVSARLIADRDSNKLIGWQTDVRWRLVARPTVRDADDQLY